jgi:hypothetical protein
LSYSINVPTIGKGVSAHGSVPFSSERRDEEEIGAHSLPTGRSPPHFPFPLLSGEGKTKLAIISELSFCPSRQKAYNSLNDRRRMRDSLCAASN